MIFTLYFILLCSVACTVVGSRCPVRPMTLSFPINNDTVRIEFCDVVDFKRTIAAKVYGLVEISGMNYEECAGNKLCTILAVTRNIYSCVLLFNWTNLVVPEKPKHCFEIKDVKLPITSTVNTDSYFAPQGFYASFVAIYQIWNILNRFMLRHDPDADTSGHIRPVQVLDMLSTIDRIGAQTYCEIGFNGGHSAAAILAARPHMNVYSFDIAEHVYTNANAAFLKHAHPDNFEFIRGDSMLTVRQYAQSILQGKCDIMFVDGSHSVQAVLYDIMHLAPAASAHHVLYIDDTVCLDWKCFVSSVTYGWCPMESVMHSESLARYVTEDLKALGVLSSVQFFDYPCGDPCDNTPHTNWGWAKAMYGNNVLALLMKPENMKIDAMYMTNFLFAKALFWHPRNMTDWFDLK